MFCDLESQFASLHPSSNGQHNSQQPTATKFASVAVGQIIEK
jgi:hypothetical protein